MFWNKKKRFEELEHYKIIDAYELSSISKDGIAEYWSKVVSPRLLEASIKGNNSLVLYPSVDFDSVIQFGKSQGYKIEKKSDYSPWMGEHNHRLLIKW